MNLYKNHEFSVLDHGYIRVIDFMGTDESIIEAARMSTGKGFQGWKAGERCSQCGWRADDVFPDKCGPVGMHHIMEKVHGDMSLLDYLWRHGHMTPFEMCELHLEVYAPILVFRQWHRHRSQSFNEASARYAKMSDDHYVPNFERVQAQGKTNKQGSSGELDIQTVADWRTAMSHEQDEVYNSYENAIERGIANETARLNTPVSRYSKMRVKTDLRNWLAFLKLRMHEHAQWEIRQYADIIGNKIIAELWPRTWELFEEHTLKGAQMSNSELSVMRLMFISKYTPQEACAAVGLVGTKQLEFLKKLGL